MLSFYCINFNIASIPYVESSMDVLSAIVLLKSILREYYDLAFSCCYFCDFSDKKERAAKRHALNNIVRRWIFIAAQRFSADCKQSHDLCAVRRLPLAPKSISAIINLQ